MEKGFIFSARRCIGCHACIVACTIYNNTGADTNWRSVYDFNHRKHPALPVFFHSMACHHCREARCMTHCPAGAYYRDPQTQAVLINQDKCIGCKYCTWACPFDAPKFNPGTGVIGKCTGCFETLQAGGMPACATGCPTGALKFGSIEMSDYQYTTNGFRDHNMHPRISFTGRVGEERSPLMVPDQEMMKTPAWVASSPEESGSGISIRAEWTLVLFTLVVPLLTGLLAGLGFNMIAFPRLLFLAIGCLTLILSSLHLGKRSRSIRSVWNIQSSWLSREILLYLLFLLTASLYLAFPESTWWLLIPTLVFGFSAAFSIDMVYPIKSENRSGLFHSSQAFLSVCLYSGIFLEAVYPVLFIIGLKLILYTSRKVRFHTEGRRIRLPLSLFRVVAGLVFPVIWWITSPETGWLIMLLAIISGETADRCEFYIELEFSSPEKELHQYFLKRLGSV